MGTRFNQMFVLNISDPLNPVIVDVIDHGGGNFVRDVSFDAAGNVYAVSNSAETLRIFSPGGEWTTALGSDGTFNIVPEPATLALLTFGAALLGLFRSRRKR